MSEINALNELRILADTNRNIWWSRILFEYLDKAESEIAERYMLQPVDADGVPIRVGDRLYVGERELVANGITFYHNTWRVVTDFAAFDDGYLPRVDHQMRWAKDCRHVKPRTLEDVLIEYRLEAYNLYADQELTGEERVNEFKKLDAEYNSEIRELFGGDA